MQATWSLSSSPVGTIGKLKEITVQYGIGLGCDMTIRRVKKSREKNLTPFYRVKNSLAPEMLK